MLRYTQGAETRLGGVDVTLSLPSEQAAALSSDAAVLAEELDTVLGGIAELRAGTADRVRAERLLAEAAALLTRLEGVRDAGIRAHAGGGGTYGQLAVALGMPLTTAQSRRDGLAGAEPSAAERWARGEYAPVDHPGVRVPEALRDWSVSWPGYLPVEITPPELRTASLAEAVPTWAEPAVTPDKVTDWAERQSEALIPFDLDDRWWPLNPHGRTGRSGRNLGKWGENQAADPLVVAGTGSDRHVLLIQRADRGVWAIPGGMVDPGETAPATLVRELREETGVDLAEITPVILQRTVVDDWRNTDHAWAASTVALYKVPEQVAATAGDDAAAAQWLPFADLDQLDHALTAADGQLYEAHRPLLATALGRLNQD